MELYLIRFLTMIFNMIPCRDANDGVPPGERLTKLNQIAIHQMQALEDNESRKLLK